MLHLDNLPQYDMMSVKPPANIETAVDSRTPGDFRRTTLEAVSSWLAELDSSGIHPRIVPFQLTADQATARFEQWHKDKYLSPGGLSKVAAPLRRAALPFWLFETSVHIYYKGAKPVSLKDAPTARHKLLCLRGHRMLLSIRLA